MKNLFRYIMASVFTIAGILHFKRLDGFRKIVPSYLPFKQGIVIISGIVEIIFGLVLLVKRPGTLMKTMISGFLYAVLPANIYMARKEIPLGEIRVPKPLLYLRIPLQFILIGIIKRL